jgi:glycine hydroxymethyltransferase
MLDLEIKQAIQKEAQRQDNNIELIASENYVSSDIREAVGSVLTNKYAEGYPNKRYYGGCEAVDEIERLAIERACQLFGAEHANVQAHSGSQANMAVYMSVLKPQDTVLGMDLAAGGHLTHGHPLNFSGQLYRFEAYTVDPKTYRLNYNAIRQQAHQLKPRMIVAGASAYPYLIDFAEFRSIADEVGAYLMVDMAHIAGLVAAKCHPSPIPYADFVTSTTHKTLRGPRGGLILCPAKHAQKLDKQLFPGIQGGPLMHVIAGKAICFKEASTADFVTYTKQVLSNMQALVERLKDKGYQVIGSENHMCLLDVKTSVELTGKQAELVLDEVGITCNKNSIPFDTEKPMTTSGIRLGSAAMTTRGFKEAEFIQLADWIDQVLKHSDDKEVKERVKTEVSLLTRQFPCP